MNLNSEVLDSSGNNRFKNGILVDTFEGHNIAETTAFDHQWSIDMTEGELQHLCEKFVEKKSILQIQLEQQMVIRKQVN